MPAILLYILAGLALLALGILLLQEYFIFKPEKLHPDFCYRYNIPFRELNFSPAPGVTINGLHFYRESPLGLVLYFHGNTRSIKGWARYAKDFYRYNYDVVLVDYRGFGKSTGARSERKMLEDVDFVYRQLALVYGESHLVIYGRSLGSGFAAKVASANNPRFLILDAPYFNFPRVVQRFIPLLPVRYILRYHFRSDIWVPRVSCPVYIIHGTRDWLIPISHSLSLQKLNPHRTTLIRIPGGGHNNLTSFPEYHNMLRDILSW